MSNKLKDVYGFIYITTNLINGKRYIGQKKFEEGINFYKWKSYLGSGVLLSKAIEKYGKENFIKDIVALAYSEEELNKMENEWINSYNAIYDDNYYNIAEGGRKNPFAGKSDEEMVVIREKAGKSISKINSGENHPNYGRCESDYTKSKIRDSMKKMYYNNPELKKTKKFSSRERRKVICITTGMVFDGVGIASRYYNIDRTGISKCCNKERNCAGVLDDGTPLVWRYYNP